MKAFFAAILAFFTVFSTVLNDGELRQEFTDKGDISGYADTVEVKKVLPDFYVDNDGEFTVLQISDTHMTSCFNLSDLMIIENIKVRVEKYKPDLVVMSGDMIDDGNSGIFNKAYVLRTVAETFEELEQYWAYIPGNNDGVNYGTSADVAAYLVQYEHCLVSDERDISGGTQYSIDVYDGDSLTHSFVFMDTMDYDNDDPDHTYGYVHADQVEWAKQEIASKQAENPDVKISAFLHENTPNFKRAAESGEAYKSGYATISKQAEKYNIPKNQPLDDVFDESGAVGLVAIGHVHPAVPQCSFYNGTYYHIAQKASLSATLITIDTDCDNIRDMYTFEKV